MHKHLERVKFAPPTLLLLPTITTTPKEVKFNTDFAYNRQIQFSSSLLFLLGEDAPGSWPVNVEEKAFRIASDDTFSAASVALERFETIITSFNLSNASPKRPVPFSYYMKNTSNGEINWVSCNSSYS